MARDTSREQFRPPIVLYATTSPAYAAAVRRIADELGLTGEVKVTPMGKLGDATLDVIPHRFKYGDESTFRLVHDALKNLTGNHPSHSFEVPASVDGEYEAPLSDTTESDVA